MTRQEFWQRAFVAALSRADRPFFLGGADVYGPRGTEIRFDPPLKPDQIMVRDSAFAADQALAEYDARFPAESS